jgi:hypothetical protein
MNDIYDILKELKNISDAAQSNEMKERIDNMIKSLNNIQDDIFKDLESIDAYSHGDEIGQAICEIMEKIDYKAYLNEYCNTTIAHDNED